MRTLWWVWSNRFNLDFERGPRWCYKGSEWGNLHRRLVLTHAPLHAFCNIDPDEPANILVFSAFEWTHAVPQSFCLNTKCRTSKHVRHVLYAWHVPLRKVAVGRCCTEEHITHILHARDVPLRDLTVEQFRIWKQPAHVCDTRYIPPNGLSKHSPLGDSLRHATTALLSFDWDNGENAALGRAGAVEVWFLSTEGDCAIGICVRVIINSR